MAFDLVTLEKTLADAEALVPGVTLLWQDVLELMTGKKGRTATALNWPAALALLKTLLALLLPLLAPKAAVAGCGPDDSLKCALKCALCTVQCLL